MVCVDKKDLTDLLDAAENEGDGRVEHLIYYEWKAATQMQHLQVLADENAELNCLIDQRSVEHECEKSSLVGAIEDLQADLATSKEREMVLTDEHERLNGSLDADLEEIKRLQQDLAAAQKQNAEAEAAEMRQVLHDIYPTLAGKVISMHGDEGTRAYQEWSEVANKVFQAEQSTTAGAGLLGQLKRQDAMVSALRRLKAAEKRTGAASLCGLQEMVAASQERQDAEKALDVTLAELDGETNG
jgi:seryl-tRNA synthetase